MSERPSNEQFEQKIIEIRHKRILMLQSAYDAMSQKYIAVREGTRLHPGLVANLVEDYLGDYKALVGRYNIKGRIAKHKIAGLMAAGILKHRPIQLVDFSDESAGRVSMDNEEFAFLHGLAICAEGTAPADLVKFSQLPNLYCWHEDLLYVFKRRPDSAECFNMIFATISLTLFPTNFHDGE